jgi:alpha-amylase
LTGDRGPVTAFVYDSAPRLALLDHLYEGRPRAEELRDATAREVSLGSWREGAERAGARFEEAVGDAHARLTLAAPSGVVRRKEIEMNAQAASLVVRYVLAAAEGAGEIRDGAPVAFTAGPEIPLALWEAHGRIVVTPRSGPRREESLSSPIDVEEASSVTLTNDLTGLSVTLEPSPPAAVRAFPLRTISRSEGGYDEIYQGTVVQVLWDLPAPGDTPLRATLLLRLSKA